MWTELNVSTSEEAQTTQQDAPQTAPQEAPPTKPFVAYDPGPIPPRRQRDPHRATKIVLFAATLVALWYVTTNVMKYANPTRETYGIFWPRHQWLFIHAIAGTIALVFGPIQFWLGLKREQVALHRVIGVAYVTSVGIGAVSALYLAFHTVYGWMFGAGLTGMAIAWITTTAIAVIAISRRMVPLHRQWVIRSYVVTFGFVFLRLVTDVLEMSNVGSLPERLTFASWVAWTVPLLIVEGVFQARKVFAKQPSVNEA
jgi:hypothetical protein